LKNNNFDENRQPEAMTPLAIVGIGSLFPRAGDTGTFWSNIRQGVDAITEVPESHWRSDDYFDPDPKSADKVYAKCGGFLSPVDFNPMEYGVLPNALEAIDTSQLLGLVAVEQALQDAGYTAEKEFDRDKVSVILGVTGTLELVVSAIPAGAKRSRMPASPMRLPKTSCSASAIPTCPGRRTPFPACSATWWPDGSASTLILAAPTVSSMPPAAAR
jgi:3-oxoacyl-(acyl-carrier-protein) synthase